MSEAPDVEVSKSSTYKEIYVTGQVVNIGYNGLNLTVLHDSQSLEKALSGNEFKISKAVINREIECTLNLSPINMKAWAMMFQQNVEQYERMFGRIMSPEEVSEKFRQGGSGPQA